jgi:ribosomal protein S16
MSRTLPTEESLGLSPTDEELGTVVTNDDDDIPQNDDAEPALAPAKPGPEKAAKPDPEPEGDKPPEPGKPEDEQPKQVDVRALQEARAEAREAKRQAAILEQRWNDFLAGQREPAKPEPEQPVVPGPDDPMGRLNWTVEQLAAFQEQQRQTTAQQAEAQRSEQAFQQAFAAVDADYRASVAADPTLAEAYSALRESQGKELLALGYTIPQAQAELARIEREHVMYVAQRGTSIADHIKALAAVRGWQPKAQQPVPQKTDIAAVAAAQQRHQSLSDAGGGEAVAPLDAKALARMSDKEFKAWMSKKGSEAKFDEIMGA